MVHLMDERDRLSEADRSSDHENSSTRTNSSVPVTALLPAPFLYSLTVCVTLWLQYREMLVCNIVYPTHVSRVHTSKWIELWTLVCLYHSGQWTVEILHHRREQVSFSFFWRYCRSSISNVMGRSEKNTQILIKNCICAQARLPGCEDRVLPSNSSMWPGWFPPTTEVSLTLRNTQGMKWQKLSQVCYWWAECRDKKMSLTLLSQCDLLLPRCTAGPACDWLGQQPAPMQLVA